jgi:hypothetical protein
MKPLIFEDLNVYLPDDIRAGVDQIAASRGISPQQLLNETMKANRKRWNIELSCKACDILECGGEWPDDPMEGLMVGCLYSFLLAEADDNFTGAWENDPHYIAMEVMSREEDEEEDEEDEGDDDDPAECWKES